MSDNDSNNQSTSGETAGIFAPPPGDEVHTYDASDGDGSGRRPMLTLGVLLLATAFGGVLFIAYQQGMKEGGRTAPPIVKAEKTPAKVTPSQPGGMEIPHQDKRVYERINGEEATQPAVENLMPRAEEPMRIPQEPEKEVAAAPPSAAPSSGSTPATVPPKMEILPRAIELPGEQPSTPQAATPPSAPTEIPAQTTRASAETPPAVAAAPSSPPATPPSVPATPEIETAAARPAPQVLEGPDVATGKYVIQIAAFREQTQATKQFGVLQKKYADLLGALAPDVQRADLGDKGVYYRLRLGPFADKASAGDVCQQLKARGQDCLVKVR